MEKFEELKAKVAEIEAEADKFYGKGNKAAGTRLRKGLQEIKNLSQEIRVDVSEKKKAEAVA
jgi:hypothetical protein